MQTLSPSGLKCHVSINLLIDIPVTNQINRNYEDQEIKKVLHKSHRYSYPMTIYEILLFIKNRFSFSNLKSINKNHAKFDQDFASIKHTIKISIAVLG